MKHLLRLCRLPLLLLVLHGAAVVAQTTASLEYQVKAAFLYKFPAYVQWPAAAFADAEAPLAIGVLGSDAMLENLQILAAGQAGEDRPVVVRRLDSDGSPEGLHILFVGVAADPGGELLERAIAAGVLTVTETGQDEFDGMINFAIVNNRVRFDIALAPVERAGLRFSSRLLQVAERVLE